MKRFDWLIQSCSLFRGISLPELDALLQCLGATVKRFQKDETIFHEGAPAQTFGVVCKGLVRMERMDYEGNRTLVGTVGPAGLFGESFACAETETFPLSAIAAESSEVLFLDYRNITKPCCNACSFHHQIIANLLRTVAEKNILLHRRTEIVSRRTTREKILAYLDLQAKEHNSRIFTIPFDRQSLADYLEVERSGLSAELSKLRKEGLLRCRKNEFELL